MLFRSKKPDPLEIGYQAHLPPESLSQLVSRQPPKSPQVLYSPVSPLSPHRLLAHTLPLASSLGHLQKQMSRGYMQLIPDLLVNYLGL